MADLGQTRWRRWRAAARDLNQESYALHLAARDPRVPWYAKVLDGLVVAYALSPIDLIPDVIPVLGYLDDLLLVPLGIALAIKLIPADIMAECRARAAQRFRAGHLVSWAGALIVVLVWVAILAGAIWIAQRAMRA